MAERLIARERNLRTRIAWARIVEPGSEYAAKLIKELGIYEALRAVLAGHHPEVTKGRSYSNESVRHALDKAEHDLQAAHEAGFSPIGPSDAHWPVALEEMGTAAPFVLWVKGDPALLSSPILAITGARAITSYGSFLAANIVDHVARNGVTVLSGLSYGVEALAHRAAYAAGAASIAVLASGPDRPYSASHTALLEQVAERGVVISEFPPGAAPTRSRFQRRAHIMAALAGAIVIPEAGPRSGALGLARIASDLDKPVGAVPGPVTNPASEGCHQLIQTGFASLVTSGEEAVALIC